MRLQTTLGDDNNNELWVDNPEVTCWMYTYFFFFSFGLDPSHLSYRVSLEQFLFFFLDPDAIIRLIES